MSSSLVVVGVPSRISGPLTKRLWYGLFLNLACQSFLQHEMVARVVDSGRTVLMSLHDLDMAAAYCERVVLMSRGRIVADGAPSEVLTARIVEEVYGVSARRADVDGRVRLLVGR